jgi:hypothetical protein
MNNINLISKQFLKSDIFIMPLYSYNMEDIKITLFETLESKEGFDIIQYDVWVDNGLSSIKTTPRVKKSVEEERSIRRRLAHSVAKQHKSMYGVIKDNVRNTKRVKFDNKKQVYIYNYNSQIITTDLALGNNTKNVYNINWLQNFVSWLYGYDVVPFKNGKLVIVREQQKFAF